MTANSDIKAIVFNDEKGTLKRQWLKWIRICKTLQQADQMG